MIRAQKEDVPNDLMDLFRKSDPRKDSQTFWELLREWYQDDSDGSWFGDWDRFHFPEAPASDPFPFFMSVFRRSLFRNAVFEGVVDFGMCTFESQANYVSSLDGATFRQSARFIDTKFLDAATFNRATFARDAIFAGTHFHQTVSFKRASFGGETSFSKATFSSPARAQGCAVEPVASFAHATCSGDLSFIDCLVEGELLLNLHLKSEGSLMLSELGTAREGNDELPYGSPRIRLGQMSLAHVSMKALDLTETRFAGAVDFEKAFITNDVVWPPWKEGRPRLADEDDLEDDSHENGPSAEDVERAYRGIRKSMEDRSDRVGAHPWYVSEMEVGRLHAPRWSFRRLARDFYRATSSYGLSATRPALWLCLVASLAFSLFSIPVEGICPETAEPVLEMGCVGWADRVEVVILATFLQPPPNDVVLSGAPAQTVWLFVRLMGAAMLVAIAVAFRNQIAR